MADPYVTVNRRPEYLELREKALLDAIFGEYNKSKGFTGGLIQDPDMFKIAPFRLAEQVGRDPVTGEITDFGLETYGSQFLQQDTDGDGVPDFMERTTPYFDQAEAGLREGIGSLEQARDIIADPMSVQNFMNPFTQAVIDETERDIDRQGQIALNRAADQAIKAGAFGGSRQGIQAAEVERNIMDAKRKATTDLRMKNFAQAQKAAQEAGRLVGGIGQSFGTLGTQAADTGRVFGAMTPADLAFMQGTGEAERAYRQQMIDTARQEYQRPTEQALLPYNYAYGALSGTPSAGLYSTTQQPMYGTNPMLAGIGAYTALQGIGQQQ
tara:strand:- start:141 stop:1115 length:975 start_codon:yes stop_codon:yes gene_type:complete